MSRPDFQQEPPEAVAADAATAAAIDPQLYNPHSNSEPVVGNEHWSPRQDSNQNDNDQAMGNYGTQPQIDSPDEGLQDLFRDMLNQMTTFLAKQDIGHAQEIARTLLLWPEVPSDYRICAHALLAFGRPNSDQHPTNSTTGLDGEVMARFFDRRMGEDEQKVLAETCNALKDCGQR